jgi:hypothetical protein
VKRAKGEWEWEWVKRLTEKRARKRGGNRKKSIGKGAAEDTAIEK